jgi:hypothetical protein
MKVTPEPRDGRIPYTGFLHYVPQRIQAAAIYCSDGRMGAHFDDFLQKGLRLPRYDRIALPGGPACLAGHAECALQWPGVCEQIRFLAEAHGLKRIVLIAHQSCAFYAQCLNLPEDTMEPHQRRDLAQAAERILSAAPGLVIEPWFARIRGDRIAFEPV